MSRVCILTDSTAQFTQSKFPGHDRVFVIPFDWHEKAPQESLHYPLQRQSIIQQLVPPSPQEYLGYFNQLSCDYDAILVITLSSAFSPIYHNAQRALALNGNTTSIQILDSQSTMIGLGLLVQTAAAAAAAGASLTEIEYRMRVLIPHVYMLLCIPELFYLTENGYLSHSQALVGELLGLLPIYSMEEGRLTLMEKVRTQRHLLDSFQDFLDEFETLSYIALIRGGGYINPRIHPFRKYVQERFPRTPFSEHIINPHLSALFGRQSIGIVVMDTLDKGQDNQ